MKVLFAGPCRVGALLWQERSGYGWQLSLICKVTYALSPGACALDEVQEELNEEENHWNDDPQRSVYAPLDLVPFKRRADVILVGQAYAPRGEPVRSLVARMIVGDIDKSIEICADRFWGQDGVLGEGLRFSKRGLQYERAAGGPETQNPVGISAEGPANAYGQLVLPNLQPPGHQPRQRGQFIEPVGFGPIAASWPARVARLGGLAGRWDPLKLAGTALPSQLDRDYFNVAPPDQQTDTMIRADERMVLENLHPEHPRLVTSLPGVRPAAIVERGGRRMDTPFVGDTLWIDTDRRRCTVTFRSVLPLTDWAEEGLVRVTLVSPGQPGFPDVTQGTWSSATIHGEDVVRRAARPAPPPAPTPSRPSVPSTPTFSGAHAEELTNTTEVPGWQPLPAGEAGPPAAPPPLRQKANTVPVWGSAAGDASPNWLRPGSVVPVAGDITAVPTRGPSLSSSGVSGPAWLGSSIVESRAEERPGSVASFPPRVAMPAALGLPEVAPAASAPPASPWAGSPGMGPTAAPLPPPLVMPAALSAEPGTSLAGIALASNAAAARSALGVPSSVSALREVERAPAGKEEPAAPPLAGASARGSWGTPNKGAVASGAAAAASDAAVEGARRREQAAAAGEVRDRSSREPESGQSGEPSSSSRFELLWHEPEAAERVRQKAAGRRESGTWSSSVSPGRTPADDRRDIARILSRSKPLDDHGVERAVNEAFDEDGLFTEPLGVVQGEIQLPFDERAQLTLLTEIVAPFVAGDKRLKELLDSAAEALKTPSADLFDSVSARIKAAFAQGARGVPPSYLDDAVDRILLNRRSYQLKTLLGGPRVRALFHGASGSGPGWTLVAYLPEAAASRLPLFSRFKAAVLAELRAPQDQYEGSPHALMVLALARSV